MSSRAKSRSAIESVGIRTLSKTSALGYFLSTVDHRRRAVVVHSPGASGRTGPPGSRSTSSRRKVAKKPRLGHVLAQHRQADRQRGREQQPDRPPEPGPEHRRDQQRQGRDPGRLAVDHRLQEPCSPRPPAPRRGRGSSSGLVPVAPRSRSRTSSGSAKAVAGAGVGDEPEGAGQEAPEEGVLDADRPEAQADDQAESPC